MRCREEGNGGRESEKESYIATKGKGSRASLVLPLSLNPISTINFKKTRSQPFFDIRLETRRLNLQDCKYVMTSNRNGFQTSKRTDF